MNRGCLAALCVAGIAACAPVPDSGNVVTLEPVSPQARAARDAALRESPGTAAAAPAAAATGAPVLTDDQTYRGGPATPAPATAGAYAVVTPEPVPPRPGGGEPSVVAFALATSHPVGTQRYDRSLASEARANRACARYASADQAQSAFLGAGGPETDGQGLDPDGDGYACGWTPVPFRQAVGRN